MLVPAITIDALAIEGMVILPPEICGLVVGDLNIPALNLLLLEIPEIEIPDFTNCPISIGIPSPISFASSVYPLYEVDGLDPSISIIDSIWDNVNVGYDAANKFDSVTAQALVVEGRLQAPHLSRQVVDSIEPSVGISGATLHSINLYVSANDGIAVGSKCVSGSMRSIRINTTSADGISAEGVTVVGAIWTGAVHYDGVLGDNGEESLQTTATLLTGNRVTFEYLTHDLENEDGLGNVTATIISGNRDSYEYLSRTVEADALGGMKVQLMSGSRIHYEYLSNTVEPEGLGQVTATIISGERSNG